jgi:hypothetical protein
MKKLLHEYWVELFFVVLGLTGFELIVTRVEIHTILIDLFKQWFNATRMTTSRATDAAVAFINDLSLYDLIGFLLLVTAIYILLYRVRRRYLNSRRWQGDICPRCRGHIERIHRTSQDRILVFLLRRPFHRYQCMNRACGWSGLFYGKPHDHPADSANPRAIHSAVK